ncbi:MAG TPA: acyl-CoA synthetase [Solirubrobacteraceae bacterium]|jgi:fatty-acyl-CoA synthase|nr:acyl-CoA synthetase [Solirubrobacteraceae bacterium]
MSGPHASKLDHLGNTVHTVRQLVKAGVVRFERPDKLIALAKAIRAWGPTPAAGYTASAIRVPDSIAIDDELGTLTFRELHVRTNALAHGMRAAGIVEGDGIGILCRNHRGFVEATVACSKLGASALYLNTGFAGPQIRDVIARENPAGLIFDDEYTGLIGDQAAGRHCFIAWHDGNAATRSDNAVEGGRMTLEALIAGGDQTDLTPPSRRGKVVILTSGTTGTPRGAARRQPESLSPAAALFSKIPLKAREPTVIAAPLFHTWGFAHFTLGLALSSTLVLRRRFDAAEILEAAATSHATALIVVPVMLQRIIELPPAATAGLDLSRLRIIAVSGSALPGELATKVMDRLGDVVYNLYGSTEVAWVTIATPADLRAAPGTAGTPPRGTTVRLYDDADQPVDPGAPGRIFVANEMLFDGYTGGGSKAVIDGLMSTGDVGHFDQAGRLFVDGRDDDMIISGGENVFPREIEDLLHAHPEIDDVSVIGVPDDQFGQGLKAFVVLASGSQLDSTAVKTHVRDNLARYKVPRDVVFVVELPRNATGKVLKRELRLQQD